MKRASLAAATAALLSFGSASSAIAADDRSDDGTRPEEARIAEERLLGSADEDARYLACQPFTREIAARGAVSRSLDASLAEAGVPAAAMLEARQALATAIDLDSDVRAGDRFYVRYEQTFTAEGAPIGVGRVMWAELRTKAKGTVAIHRFRSSDKTERFWLANGLAATPPSMRLPLDIVAVSSGFGWRPDPLDKPAPAAQVMASPPQPASSAAAGFVNAPAPAVAQPAAPVQEEPVKPAPRHTVRGGIGFPGQFAFGGPTDPRSDLARLELERLAAERAAQARRAAAAPVDLPSDTTERTEVAVAKPPATRAPPRLFMHDGLDLVAATGTPVYAASDVVVIGAAPNGGYGNWIRIDHRGPLATVYGHLSGFAAGIEVGARVSQGDLIGFVGNTGRSTGSHLHFEILNNGRAVDPLVYPEIKPAQLRGADLERFRKQVKQALLERDRETALALSFGDF